ncbi:MAG: hypothetical protein R2735_04210 [Microthrixaceae bacterium]
MTLTDATSPSIETAEDGTARASVDSARTTAIDAVEPFLSTAAPSVDPAVAPETDDNGIGRVAVGTLGSANANDLTRENLMRPIHCDERSLAGLERWKVSDADGCVHLVASFADNDDRRQDEPLETA